MKHEMYRSKRRVMVSHGLGNQLFQFTFAHFLRKFSPTVFLENSPIFPVGHTFMLERLQSVCSHLIFYKNFTISHTSLLGRTMYKYRIANLYQNYIIHGGKDNFVHEAMAENFSFLGNKLSLFKTNTTHVGFWQHWKYLDHENYLVAREILETLNTISGPRSIISKSQETKVVIHVRRGDYLNRGLDQVFGVISPSSYLDLLDDLLAKFTRLDVTTITDDLELFDNKKYSRRFGRILTPDLCNTWQGLKMMAEADIVIAANSTYSWWGAVLNFISGGTSYIPKTFFQKLETNDAFDFPGLIKYDNSFKNNLQST